MRSLCTHKAEIYGDKSYGRRSLFLAGRLLSAFTRQGGPRPWSSQLPAPRAPPFTTPRPRALKEPS